MVVISKKYVRCSLLVVGILTVLKLLSVINSFAERIARNASTPLNYFILNFGQSTLDSDNYENELEELSESLKDVNGNGTIVVGIGRRACFHITKHIEFCPSYQRTNTLGDVVSIKRHIINKDMRGSRGIKLLGFSSYFTFDTITVDELFRYLSTLKSQKDSILDGLVKPMNEDFEFFRKDSLNFDVAKLTPGALSSFDYISDFNLLFGEDCSDPRPGWELYRDFDVCEGRNHCFLSSIKLKSRPEVSKVPQLKADDENNFKIVQLADLHFSVGKGHCLDEFPQHESCEADPKTIMFINQVLDLERPQLVVFTGDQLMGDECKQDSETALFKVMDPVIRREIPFAMVWGNHDDEGSLDRWQLSELVESMPFSLFQFSESDTRDNKFGVGNYKHHVFDQDGKPIMNLYFLDSHKYSPNPRAYSGYDWIKETQWSFLKEGHSEVSKDANEDLPNIMSMAFFHIPLPEYVNAKSVQSPHHNNPMVGTFKEGITAPKYNSGGLQTLQELGVTVVSVGHDHCNDYCLLDDSHSENNQNRIWLCYGGAAGEGGYAGYGGTERRIRIFNVNLSQREIQTWKRLNSEPEKELDRQVLVSDGVPNTV